MIYNSDTNVLGGIPDYMELLNYIRNIGQHESEDLFAFRTQKTFERFVKSIETGILKFADDKHKKLFMNAINNDDLSNAEKLLVLFWQMVYANDLFHRITEDVFVKAAFQGRVSLALNDILSYLHHLKAEEGAFEGWSESTLKVTASKYLTTLKKVGLADGAIRKNIVHPTISNDLFVYFIKWTHAVYSSDNSLNNPYMKFCLLDNNTVISRAKRIENLPYWDIAQIGDELTIELKDHE